MAWCMTLPDLAAGNKWYDLLGLNNGALTNMSTGSGWAGTTRPGGFGHLVFDGTNDYVSLGNPLGLSNLQSSALTISVWIYTTTVAVGTKGVIYDRNSAATTCMIGLEINRTAAKVSINCNETIVYTGSTSLVVNTWQMITIVRSGSAGAWNYAGYINGLADTTSSNAHNSDASSGFSIGRPGQFNGQYFTGNIDSPRIMSRALSASEVWNLYIEELTGYPTTLNRIASVFYSISAVQNTLALSCAGTGTAAIIRQIAKPYSAGGTGTGLLVRQSGKIVLVTANDTTMVIRQTGKPLSGAGSATAAAIRQTGKQDAATATGSSSLSRAISKTYSAVASCSASVLKAIGKIFADLSATGTAALDTLKILVTSLIKVSSKASGDGVTGKASGDIVSGIGRGDDNISTKGGVG